MSRRRGGEGADLHARFNAWLLGDGALDPPRDVALHASVCPGCGQAMAAFDALAAIDPGRAALPPSRVAVEPRPRGLVRAGRIAAGLAGVLLAATLTGVGLSQLGAFDAPGGAPADETPAQGVLGATGQASASGLQASGFGGGVLTGTPTPTASGSSVESAQPQPTNVPSAYPTARPGTPAPTTGGTPVSTASPTSAVTPTLAPTPTPTSVPTASPTPTPEPTPEPTPVPDDCADGIDNDGDLLIDALDPGCVLDGNEPSA